MAFTSIESSDLDKSRAFIRILQDIEYASQDMGIFIPKLSNMHYKILNIHQNI